MKESWVGNVVAVGLSSHFLEPMEATNIEYATKQLDYITKVINNDMSVGEFNNKIKEITHEIRCFIKLHYLNDFPKNNFWKIQNDIQEWFLETHSNLILKNNFNYIKEKGWNWYDNYSWCCILDGVGVKPKAVIDDAALMAQYDKTVMENS